jgi:hypothetical protein
MKKFISLTMCHASDCPEQKNRGYLRLCGQKNQESCPWRDKNPYGRYDIEDILLLSSPNNKGKTDRG